MIRILLPYVYRLAESLDPLSRLPTGPDLKLSDVYLELVMAESAISSFIGNSVFSQSIRSSRNYAHELIDLISKTTGDASNFQKHVTEFEIFQIKSSYEQYKIALQAELGIIPAFYVTQKGSHDTLSLLDAPETLFPINLRLKIPESKKDIEEAGKALAFDLPTACGYHTFRIIEIVLRRYYSHVTGNKINAKSRSIGTYVYNMKKANVGDGIIISTLEQIAKLHRNPLIHPEVNLTIDEAISILGIARSVVTYMLSVIPDQAHSN